MDPLSTQNSEVIFDPQDCVLNIIHKRTGQVASSCWKNPQDLLAAFLNRDYDPQKFGLLKVPFDVHNDLVKRLDTWNHKEITDTIKAIYETGRIFCENLRPSQRLRIHLGLPGRSLCFRRPQHDQLDQLYNDGIDIIHAANMNGLNFVAIVDEYKNHGYCDSDARYLASCSVASQLNITLPQNEQFFFKSVRDFVPWLLNFVAKKNRHIYKCEYCGRFFGCTKSDAKFCGQSCRNDNTALNGSFGKPEINRLYSNVESAYCDRISTSKKRGYNYYKDGDSPLNFVDLSALKDAFQREYRKYTEELLLLKDEGDLEQFEAKASAIESWLLTKLDEARSYIPNRDGI